MLPRSGLAARHGIALANAPGLIDAGYRGEVRVLLLNTDREARSRSRSATGSRSSWSWRSRRLEFTEAAELPGSARAQGGFGSTGR